MNTQVGKSVGFALLLAAGLLAALFAMGVFSATGVGAQATSAETAKPAFAEDTYTFSVEKDADGSDTAEPVGSVVVTLNDTDTDDDTPPVFEGPNNNDVRFRLVEPVPAGFVITPTNVADAPPPTGGAGVITYEGSKFESAVTLRVVAINNGGTPVTATATETADDRESNPVEVRVVPFNLASKLDTPGAAVRLELKAAVDANVGEEITIDLTGFGIDAGIVDNSDQIDIIAAGPARSGNPTGVRLSGSKVILTFGPLTPDTAVDTLNRTALNGFDADTAVERDAQPTIILRSGAGITNPNTAGAYAISITSESTSTADDDDGIVVRPKITLDPKMGGSGSSVTITGKGFTTDSSATVFIDDGSLSLDRGETELGDAPTDDNGTFVLTTEDIENDSLINAVDGAGGVAPVGASFDVTKSIAVTPATRSLSETLTIELKDWGDAGQVTGVSIGGRSNMVSVNEITNTDTADNARKDPLAVSSAPNDDGNLEIKVKIPATTRTGNQKVEVWTGTITYTPLTNSNERQTPVVGSDAKSASSANVTVEPLALTIAPETAVAGEKITIQGSGFNNQELITNVLVDDQPAEFADDTKASSSGNIVITVSIPSPETSPIGDGEKTVVVRGSSGREGEGTVTIPEATITVDPPESRRGSEVTITGSGFPSGDLVQVKYGADEIIVDAAAADSAGVVSLTFRVPADADIGKEHQVLVVSTGNFGEVEAKAKHSTPGAKITVTPAEAAGGSYVTIKGENMSASVGVEDITIDGVSVLPVPRPITSTDGGFEAQVLVPLRGLGDKRVTVTVDDSTTTTFMRLVEVSASQAPADVFASLGDNLQVVWQYDNATSMWASYDPAAPAELNDLDAVGAGDIVWVEVTEDQEFQGTQLYAGWNLITLK